MNSDWILLTLMLGTWLCDHASAQVLQKFDEDDFGTPYTAASCLVPPIDPVHEILDGGPTGAALRGDRRQQTLEAAGEEPGRQSATGVSR